jgi:hypothetical protein
MLFTFVTEVGGSTVTEQFEAPSLGEAIARWNSESETKPQVPAEYLDSEEPAAVEGTRNVWCLGEIGADDRFYLVHIVTTVS